MTQLRKFRACNGAIDTARLRHSIGDLQVVQSRVKAAQEIFSTKTGGVCSAFNCIADTGCSGSGTNHEGDFEKGSLKKLDKPFLLGGIAGDLLVEWEGMVHWETIDKFGNLLKFRHKAFYHPDLPGRLFSPQATLKAMTAVVKETNKNLSPLQKLWMKWHIRLGHLSFQHVRTLGIDGFLDKYMLGLTKWVKTDGCPKCATCQFGKQVRRKDGTTTTVKNPSSVGNLKKDALKPGDWIFSDQLESRVKGRLLHTAGRESPSNQFCGSTIFVDGASDFVWVEHQVTLNAADTILAKNAFERECRRMGVTVKAVSYTHLTLPTICSV